MSYNIDETNLPDHLNDSINIINNVSRLIASNLLPDVFKAISSELKHLIGFNKMNIILLSERKEGFELLEFTRDSDSSSLKEGTYFRKEGSLWAEVVKTRKPIILSDTKNDARWVGDTLFKEGIRSRLAFPLEYKNIVVGIINMESEKVNNFSEEQIALLEHIAPQLAIAVENTILLNRVSASEKKYKTLFEQAADPILIISPEGKITTVNNREEEVIGYASNELIGKEISYILPEDSQENVSKFFSNNVGCQDKAPTIEVRVKGKDKQLIPMELSQISVNAATTKEKDKQLIPMELDAIFVKSGGKQLYTQVQLRDITERKKAMEEIKNYAEHLEETNTKLKETQTQLIHSARLASVGQLAAGIVHQVNSPLGAISGRIQMIRNKLDSIDKDSLNEHLSRISNDCMRVTNIINDLLDLSRKAKPVKIRVDVNPLLEDTLGMMLHALMSKKIQVTKTLEPSLPTIKGIADDLTHVFINITTNAVDSMGENGRLEVSSRLINDSEKFTKPVVEVSIKDSGHGISDEDKQRIFEPFFTTKEPGRGVGLGLAIVKRILEFHNTQIEIEGKENEGTTFRLYFPVDE